MPRKQNAPKTPAAVAAKGTEPAGPIIECPVELGPVARKEWDRVVPLLAALNRATALDRPLLAAYCVAYAAWLDGVATLQTYGAIMKSPNGHPIQSPAVSIVNQQADLMIRIALQFGFSPASRLRFPRSSTEPSWSDGVLCLQDVAAALKPLEL